MSGLIDVFCQSKEIDKTLGTELSHTIMRWLLLIIYAYDESLSFERVHELLKTEFVSPPSTDTGSYKISKSRLVLSANQNFTSLCNIRAKYGMKNSGISRLDDTRCTKCQTVLSDYCGDNSNVNNPMYESVDHKSLDKSPKPSDCVRALTESLTVLPDGTIKVRIKKKTTFMDEYAENHRLLESNKKLENYEGMKYNLVYCLILIDSIERNVLYNARVDKESDAYKDAEKARNFAKNDLSVYLPIIKKSDRKFDINQFYKDVKADQATIEVDTVAAIKGIRKIIQAIVV